MAGTIRTLLVRSMVVLLAWMCEGTDAFAAFAAFESSDPMHALSFRVTSWTLASMLGPAFMPML
jgi:hypothetical protein